MRNLWICLNHNILTENVCGNGQSIAENYVNDIVSDCEEGTDEQESWDTQFFPLDYSLDDCPDGGIPCAPGLSNKCYQTWDSCLYSIDGYGNLAPCRNGRHLRNCSYAECSGSFKCPDSYCIPLHNVCDGVRHCALGDDERNCSVFACPGFLRCPVEGICVHENQICDGKMDCRLSGEDELYCGSVLR